jgi:hypothetical protein
MYRTLAAARPGETQHTREWKRRARVMSLAASARGFPVAAPCWSGGRISKGWAVVRPNEAVC